jgi:hypothetical protein
VKKILASAVLALSLFAAPVIPQEQVKFTAYVSKHTHQGDAVADAFVDGLTAKLKTDISEGGMVVSGDTDETLDSGPEIIVMSIPSEDGKTTAIFLDVCEHTKGQSYDVLMGAFAGRTTSDNAARDGASTASILERASAQWDAEHEVNTDPKS